MTDRELTAALEVALRASEDAISLIGRAASSVLRVEDKGVLGVVTQTDRDAEAAIRTVLKRFTGFPILGEEGGLDTQSNGRVWVVDPIDGTTNFSRGIPMSAVSIALMDRPKSLVGVIADLADWTIRGTRNHGAWCNVKRLTRPSSRVGKPVVLLEPGYASEDERTTADLTRALVGKASVRMLGSTALAMAYVAAGYADAFLSPGAQRWDFAAGLCLVPESGGMITDWAGTPWEHGNHKYVLAADPAVHQDLLSATATLQLRRPPG